MVTDHTRVMSRMRVDPQELSEVGTEKWPIVVATQPDEKVTILMCHIWVKVLTASGEEMDGCEHASNTGA
jgi:hypothetical protein